MNGLLRRLTFGFESIESERADGVEEARTNLAFQVDLSFSFKIGPIRATSGKISRSSL